MNPIERPPRSARRRFLKGLLAAGGGIGAAATVKAAPAVEPPETSPRENPSGGYRETPHVLDYYDKARS